MYAIEVKGVTKRYEMGGSPIRALDPVDLVVPAGSFVTIVGPSGCGKSTLLNLIAGFLRPSEGDIWIHGRRAQGIDPDLGLGYVTQDIKLFPWLTLAGNVEFPLRARGLPHAERRRRVRELLRLVGLEGFEDRYVYQLSGGMQKRAQLAQALSYDPDVLLMDEPFGALDAQTRMVLQHELLTIWQRTGKTILFVTHDLTEAIALSDVVWVMSRRPGRLKGRVEVGIERPRDVFHIHQHPRFASAYNALWDLLREELPFAADGAERREEADGKTATLASAGWAAGGVGRALGRGVRALDRRVDGQQPLGDPESPL